MSKILVCADVEGDFNLFFKRLAQLVSKGQNFDFVLLIGKTLNLKNECLEYMKTNFLSGPTIYFIESGELSHSLAAKYPTGGDLAPKLHFLGKIGIVTIDNIQICFISGQYNEKCNQFGFYNEETVKNFLDSYFFENRENFKGVDLLISNQWPSFVARYSHVIGGQDISFDNTALSLLAKIVKPRYHVAAGEDKHWKREPYYNYNDNANDKNVFVCRFVSLGSLNSTTKQQPFYGLNIEPISTIGLSMLCTIPEDTTINPYDGINTQVYDEYINVTKSKLDFEKKNRRRAKKKK